MTEEREEGTEPQPEPRPEERASAAGGKRRGGGLAALALLVALAAAGGVAWLVWQERQADAGPPPLAGQLDALRDELSARLDRQGDRLDELERRLQEVGHEARTAGDSVDELSSRIESRSSATEGLGSDIRALREELDALSTRVDALRDAGSAAPDASDVARRFAAAEAELLVRAAYARLGAHPDPSSALSLLQRADRQLAGLEAAGAGPARRAIAAEIEALRAVETPDRPGVAARLGALAERTGELPLALGLPQRETSTESDTPADDDAGWWRATGRFLGRYFTVRRTDESGTEVPDPATLSIIRQVLRMELEQARVAALRGDTAIYRGGIERARRLLSRHFDDSARTVSEFARSLEELSGADLELELPPTGEALDAVTRLRSRLTADA